MPATKPKKRADSRVQINLKVDADQGELLRVLAAADRRTLSGFITYHFLSRLTPDHVDQLRARARGNGLLHETLASSGETRCVSRGAAMAPANDS